MTAPLTGLAHARECLRQMREANAALSAHCQTIDSDMSSDAVDAWNKRYDHLRAEQDKAEHLFAVTVAWMIDAGVLVERKL